ncbi:hypothetical protein B0I08_107160 [Glaciihabitans tibetensis]|uniref:CAAX prenyl protease 2/Lysostaphin resistance protein A-like domain-containing protein n=1 Tax=Glaciihabitans tibetensis TaxID=1266600 RepID=A0A2T0VAT3_9MICO|nr:type II CAAX endopeptidase family protein [Glaciihabitans tibetensis]PRY67264.1 hypothetical protein B0I08_107160 [Glaciihabitans tibetensis]
MSDPALTVRRPYTLIALTTVTLVVFLGAAGTAIYLTSAQSLSPVPVVFLPVAVALAMWATITERWSALGYRSPSSDASRIALARTLPVIAMVLAVILVLTAATTGGTADLTAARWLEIIGLVVLVAFVEETLFRSLFVGILRSRGAGRAMIASSLAFSLAHSVNALSGQDVDTTIRQLVFAFVFGLSASAIFLSTGTIWITVVLHAAFNYLQLSGLNQTPAVVDWATIGIFLALAAWLWTGLATQRDSA